MVPRGVEVQALVVRTRAGLVSVEDDDGWG